jgi:glycerol-3-phosphate dehydrogenase
VSTRSGASRQPVLRETSGQERPETLQPHLWRELVGRQGALAGRIASGASAADLQPVGGSHVLWAELPWIAEHEMVRHLDDLMLRRTRLGLLTPGGGEEHLERIQRCCTTGLGWSAARWEQERKNYLSLWRRCYGPPVADSTIGTTEVLP